MFCYVYGDYFALHEPGKLQGMLAGRIEPLGPTAQWILVATSAMMAVPSIMIFVSLVARPVLNRRANIGFGLLYTAIILTTMPGALAFYMFLGVIDAVLTMLVVWYAWTWPVASGTEPAK